MGEERQRRFLGLQRPRMWEWRGQMRERIEKAKKIKEKKEKEKEKEKEGKGDKGSSGRPGSWSEGGSWRLAFRGSCGMYGYSARYYGLGQGQGVRGFQGSCYTCGEWGYSVETVVVAFDDENGNRLDGIRPKRARNFSERGAWFNRTLTQ
jgi:hypothetical protein